MTVHLTIGATGLLHGTTDLSAIDSIVGSWMPLFQDKFKITLLNDIDGTLTNSITTAISAPANNIELRTGEYGFHTVFEWTSASSGSSTVKVTVSSPTLTWSSGNIPRSGFSSIDAIENAIELAPHFATGAIQVRQVGAIPAWKAAYGTYTLTFAVSIVAGPTVGNPDITITFDFANDLHGTTLTAHSSPGGNSIFDPITNTGAKLIKRFEPVTNIFGFEITRNNVTLTNIGIVMRPVTALMPSSGEQNGVWILGTDATLENCFVDTLVSASPDLASSPVPNNFAYVIDGDDATLVNCIAKGGDDISLSGSKGYTTYKTALSNTTMYGCVAWGFKANDDGDGFSFPSGTGPSLTNCASASCTVDYDVQSDTVGDFCISASSGLLPVHFTNSIQHLQPLFEAPAGDNFRPLVNSVLIDTGKYDATYKFDFTGTKRFISQVDIGAYEGPYAVTFADPTIVINSIGTDKDFTTISDWEVATRDNLIAANEVRIGEVYEDLVLQELPVASGVDEFRYRALRPAGDLRYNPATKLGFVLTTQGASQPGAVIYDKFFKLTGFGIQLTSVPTQAFALLGMRGNGAHVDACVFFEQVPATPSGFVVTGLEVAGGENQVVTNSVFIGFFGTGSINKGLLVSAVDAHIANCIAHGIDDGTLGVGIEVTSNAVVSNTIATECVTAFSTLASTCRFCMADDSSVTGVTPFENVDPSRVYESAGTSDYHMGTNSIALNVGETLENLTTTDLLGETRDSPWDLGAVDGLVIPPILAKTETRSTFRRAVLFRIERKDGVVHRFVDDVAPLQYKGELYSAAGGFNTSARRHAISLRDHSLDIFGGLTSNAITQADMRAKRFVDAVVTEIIVDADRPWTLHHRMQQWAVLETTFENDTWTARLASQVFVAKSKSGRRMNRHCWAQLGDDECGLNIADFTDFNIATTVINDARREFECENLTGLVDMWYGLGKLTWLTGNNSGLVSEIRRSTVSGTTTTLRLQLKPPFDILSGDQFNISWGDDKLFSTCKDKFDNHDNHRGFPGIKNTDALFQTPTS